MDHVQNDVDQMMKERSKWRNEFCDNVERKVDRSNSLDHLRQTLASMDEQLQDKKRSIDALRCKIRQNDKTIERLLQLVLKSN